MRNLQYLFVALFLGGFVFLYSSQPTTAARTTHAETLVKEAESWGGALKWAISIEYIGKVDYPNMDTYNSTKVALSEAQKAVSALPESEQKRQLEERLESKVTIHFKRAMAYIDAITSGKKIQAHKATLHNNIYVYEDIEKTKASYDTLSAEIRKQAVLLYRVYGKSTRDAILEEFKDPAESLLRAVIYEITVYNALNDVEGQIAKGVSHPRLEQANIHIKNVKGSSPFWNELYSGVENANNTVKMSYAELKDLLTQQAKRTGIPPEILKAIAYNETAFTQFGRNYGPNISFDNGVGLMQITVDSNNSPYDYQRLKFDTAYNIQVGAEILKQKLDYDIPVINNGDLAFLENWYFAILAYNGLSKINDPTIYPATYQQRIYTTISNNSQVNPEALSKDDIMITYKENSNIMEFGAKMYYQTSRTTKTTQVFEIGETAILKHSVALRSKPTTSGDFISSLPAGSTLKFLGKPESDNNPSNHFVWYRVSLPNGDEGYVASVSF
ncbi:SH3 domain-containing protein [Bacillus sp. SG-1]|uniref:SH3 domain-containing protein n=1 Tax=Bacillus sp. SG-1 TaxID=161544 RepID=UPI000154502A|nr:SH3 domain-containing protein [Bacillus sp. SG-1]EDL64347.1 hypothetical protein BSG1_08666 [Bacillus sp. SG-1]